MNQVAFGSQVQGTPAPAGPSLIGLNIVILCRHGSAHGSRSIGRSPVRGCLACQPVFWNRGNQTLGKQNQKWDAKIFCLPGLLAFGPPRSSLGTQRLEFSHDLHRLCRHMLSNCTHKIERYWTAGRKGTIQLANAWGQTLRQRHKTLAPTICCSNSMELCISICTHVMTAQTCHRAADTGWSRFEPDTIPFQWAEYERAYESEASSE